MHSLAVLSEAMQEMGGALVIIGAFGHEVLPCCMWSWPRMRGCKGACAVLAFRRAWLEYGQYAKVTAARMNSMDLGLLIGGGEGACFL